jgi:hypothetical protein
MKARASSVPTVPKTPFFTYYYGEYGYSCSEYLVNSPRGFESVFEKNPDCQLVFTTENNREAQYQACLRGIPVLEWRCFTDGKVSLTNVEKDVSDGITSYTAKRM